MNKDKLDRLDKIDAVLARQGYTDPNDAPESVYRRAYAEVDGVEFRPIDLKIGNLFTLEEWLDCVASRGFIDYDGWGDLCKGNEVSNITVCPSDITKKRYEIPSWATHVLWYNR